MSGAYSNLSLIEIWVKWHGRQFKCIKDCTQTRDLICHSFSLWLWQASFFWPFIEININLSVSPFRNSSKKGREWHSVAMKGPRKRRICQPKMDIFSLEWQNNLHTPHFPCTVVSKIPGISQTSFKKHKTIANVKTKSPRSNLAAFVFIAHRSAWSNVLLPPLPSHLSTSPLYPASHSFPHSSAHRPPR